MNCIWVNAGYIHDRRIMQLSARDFKREFMAAIKGLPSAFREYVRFERQIRSREWAEIRSRIFQRDDYTCRYCSARGGRLECDHVVPVARGGSDDDSNLATACRKCNRSKAAKTLAQWRGL